MKIKDAKSLKSCLPQWLREHGLPLRKPFACLNPAQRAAVKILTKYNAAHWLEDNRKIRRCASDSPR